MEITNQTFYRGDKWTWLEDISDYPADEYTLKVYLRKAAEAAITITATAEETTKHRCTALPSVTDTEAGIYHYQATATLITDADDITTIELGEVEIKASLADQDPRSWDEQTYDLMKTTYTAMLNEAQYAQSMGISERQVVIDRAELYKQLIAFENRAQKDNPSKRYITSIQY